MAGGRTPATLAGVAPMNADERGVMSNDPSVPRVIFMTGASGYLGRRLGAVLLARGHEVHALVRPSSARRLPAGCRVVIGNALECASFAARVPPGCTLVHLVGVPHPAPWKGRQFRAVDLPATRAALTAAQTAGCRHFVYLSVAQPAPVMKAFIQVRAECEALLRASGLDATILRPWYVLGPGHWWPLALAPAYWLLERLPPTRALARRLGLVTLAQMLGALCWAIENPGSGVRILTVEDIRRGASR